MGYATLRSVERVAAAMGQLERAPIVFAAAHDIPQGGLLLAVPALLATVNPVWQKLNREVRKQHQALKKHARSLPPRV